MLLNQFLALLMFGWGWGWPQNFTQMSGWVWKNFQTTNFTMPNNTSFMKYALKSVTGLADVGDPHEDGDGPRTPPRCLGGFWKSFQMTNCTMPNNISSMKYALKSVPGLADVGVPHGWGWPQNSTHMSGGK